MHEFDYCERIDPSFWAEPVNALTNLFFIIAAFSALRYIRNKPLPKVHFFTSLLLTVVLFIIGIGSFLWHTFATPWAVMADVIPITIFMHLYIYLFVRYVANLSTLLSILFLGSFIVVNYLFGSLIDPKALNGSITYIPALIFLLMLNIQVFKTRFFRPLLQATTIFLISLTFRTIDFMVCDTVSIGTHGVWHALNAILLFLLIKLFIDAASDHDATRQQG